LEFADFCLFCASFSDKFGDSHPVRPLAHMSVTNSTHRLKVAFAGQASHASDPARVPTGLNRALCCKFEEHFVTAAYLFVDLENRLLRYSAAGHPPLMLATRAQPNVREIQENGLMLGLFPEASYSSVEIQIDSGGRCLLYTDGVLEASNAAREEFGKSRCKEFLESRRNIPAPEFADQLLGHISSFSSHNSGGT
jgi:phosphoserine phosphatase RsbU/P